MIINDMESEIQEINRLEFDVIVDIAVENVAHELALKMGLK